MPVAVMEPNPIRHRRSTPATIMADDAPMGWSRSGRLGCGSDSGRDDLVEFG